MIINNGLIQAVHFNIFSMYISGKTIRKSILWNVTIATKWGIGHLTYCAIIFREAWRLNIYWLCGSYTKHIHKHTEVQKQIDSRCVAMHKVTVLLFLGPEFFLHYHSCHLSWEMKDNRFCVFAQSCWGHTDKLYPVNVPSTILMLGWHFPGHLSRKKMFSHSFCIWYSFGKESPDIFIQVFFCAS